MNLCTRTSPCRSFSGALTQTAAGGEINVIDPGGYGTVTIGQSLTIDGYGVMAGVLATGTSGIVINAGANDTVVIRNLNIEGASSAISGISVVSAGKVYIDSVNISGFATGISVAPSATPVQVFVERSQILNNTTGISVSAANAAATVRVSDCAVQQNTTGLSATNGGAIVSFNNNRLTPNTTDGTPTQTISER